MKGVIIIIMKVVLALKSLRVLVIGLILGLSVTCGGGGGGGGSPELPPPSPIAISLTAGSSSITAGTSTTLTPVFANGTGVITPGSLAATSGTAITVSPATTTIYTLTVTSSTGASAQATTTIVVIAPTIFLTAASPTITMGYATALTPVFANGTGVITPGSLAATSGTAITVSPATTTIYTLTVTSSTGASAQATTTIVVIPAPVITSLKASSTSITSGNSTKLMPIFSNGAGKIGTTLYGDQVSTSVTSGIPVDISPTTTTSYYLTVTNSVGTKSSTSTSVTVYPAPVATSLTVGSQTIEWGSSTTITPVFTEGKGQINLDPIGSAIYNLVSGVQYPTSPKTNTRYSLRVSNAIGSYAYKEAAIQVLNAFSEGGLNVDRINHTATLLQNGKVLIVGGLSRNNNNKLELSNVLLGSAILYDPSTGGYSSTGSLTTPRSHHTATLLSNGKVLVTGGVSKIDPNGGSTLYNTMELESTKSIELYDPSTGIWNNFGLLMDTRSYHTATLLQNGKVLIVGGGKTRGSASLLFSELYDPVTQLSTRTGPSTPFYGFSQGADPTQSSASLHITLLSNGKVLIGAPLLNGASSLNSSFWLYDPSAETYATTGSIVSVGNNVKHIVKSITRLPDGKVFAFGTTTSLYNPSTETWANTQSPAIPEDAYGDYRQSSAVLLSNGKVLLFTTAANFSDGTTKFRGFFSGIFDPTTASWSNAGLLGSYRFGYAVTPLSNGKILVTGGARQLTSTTNYRSYEYELLSEYFNR